MNEINLLFQKFTFYALFWVPMFRLKINLK